MAEQAPIVAGRYRLESLLGRGGMGQVWRAHDEVLGRAVAVKEIRFPAGIADQERAILRERMMREARLTARLSHPGIATTYDVVLQDGRPFIVQELIEARNLSDEIESTGPLSAQRTAVIGLELLQALTTAHQLGIVHRDVKPSNVLLANDGRVVLTDFGIATSENDASLTSTGLLIGSPAYMSPERLRGEPTGPEADIWSLGAALYSTVEGQPPFRAATTLGVISAVLTDEVPAPTVGGPLGEAMLGMLAKEPWSRFGADQVAELLRRAVAPPVSGSIGVTSTRTTPLEPPPEGWSISTGPGEPMTVLPAVPTPSSSSASAVPSGSWNGPTESAKALDPYAPTAAPTRRPGIRTLRLALALLVVLAALSAAAVLFNNRGGAETAGDPTRHVGGRAGAGDQTGSRTTGSVSGSTGSTTASTPPATTTGSSDPGSTSSQGGSTTGAPAPSGYTLIQDPLGFQVAVPDGWHRSLDGSTRVDFISPDGTAFLRIDQREEALPDAAQAWRDAEPGVAAELPGYQRLGIEPITYRGWRGADWEFTWQGESGTVHVMDRALVVPPKGWALYVSAPDATWSSEGLPLLESASSTFQPTS